MYIERAGSPQLSRFGPSRGDTRFAIVAPIRAGPILADYSGYSQEPRRDFCTGNRCPATGSSVRPSHFAGPRGTFLTALSQKRNLDAANVEASEIHRSGAFAAARISVRTDPSREGPSPCLG
jgi:hypothetical protein